MILICYDIESNSLRSKISRKILQVGLARINKSVYLGEITDSNFHKLCGWLRQTMSAAGPHDSLIILPVTPHQVWQMEVLGANEYDVPTITRERHTLIF